RQGKKAGDIMVKDLITIAYDASVEDAVKIMNEKAVSQLPVIKNGDVVGGITDKVLVSRVASGNSLDAVLKRKVHEVMQEPFPTVSREAPLDLVAKVLNYYNAVLVYDNGKPVGIITRTDLLKKV
ncbi:MAG: CBS domain-containing protein, partial [Conexivisphaerales archaeon]